MGGDYKNIIYCVGFNSVFPLEARTFEKKQIFQEEQKTICAIIKTVLGIFF